MENLNKLTNGKQKFRDRQRIGRYANRQTCMQRLSVSATGVVLFGFGSELWFFVCFDTSQYSYTLTADTNLSFQFGYHITLANGFTELVRTRSLSDQSL